MSEILTGAAARAEERRNEIASLPPGSLSAKLRTLRLQLQYPNDRYVLDTACERLLDFADILFAAELVAECDIDSPHFPSRKRLLDDAVARVTR